jgi:antitoxin ParD1/3/4
MASTSIWGLIRMNVSLTPELERLVNEKIESGLYQTASEVVREALRLLKERDQAREQLRAEVQAGFDQLARGEGRGYDKASGRQLAERIKSRGRAARAKKSQMPYRLSALAPSGTLRKSGRTSPRTPVPPPQIDSLTPSSTDSSCWPNSPRIGRLRPGVRIARSIIQRREPRHLLPARRGHPDRSSSPWPARSRAAWYE